MRPRAIVLVFLTLVLASAIALWWRSVAVRPALPAAGATALDTVSATGEASGAAPEETAPEPQRTEEENPEATRRPEIPRPRIVEPPALHGRVVAREDGKAVADAHVSIGVVSGAACSLLENVVDSCSIRSDAAGAFSVSLPLLPRTTAPTLFVRHAGFLPSESLVQQKHLGTPQRPLRVELERGVSVAGHVLDAAGQGVVAEVTLITYAGSTSILGPTLEGASTTRSDSRGAFLVHGGVPGKQGELLVTWNGCSPLRLHLGELGSDLQGIEVRLPEMGLFAVQARLPSGALASSDCMSVLFEEDHEQYATSRSSWVDAACFFARTDRVHPVQVWAQQPSSAGTEWPDLRKAMPRRKVFYGRGEAHFGIEDREGRRQPVPVIVPVQEYFREIPRVAQRQSASTPGILSASDPTLADDLALSGALLELEFVDASTRDPLGVPVILVSRSPEVQKALSVCLPPGHEFLELRAAGYRPQRYDAELVPGHIGPLTLAFEPLR